MNTVIVVGSGIAGLVTALRASEHSVVTLITKAELGESNTRYAQGGIAAATSADDSATLHATDTLLAAAGLASAEAVAVLCSEGPEIIRELLGWGVAFDRTSTNSSGAAGLARGLEAAHSRARVLHVGGDATGAGIERALVAAVRATGIVILEQTLLTDLVVETGRVVGIDTLDRDERPRRLLADAVVIATGGAGQLFSHTTNPEVATGDGVAAAIRAGAEISDAEFYQFHPTTLAVPGNFLVSEAVRGDGAVLRNTAGERFMVGVHPDAELAPRDIVARAIAAEMSRQGGHPVFLDARELGRDELARRFPTVSAACNANGLNLATDLVPVTPAAHYWMGGIRTDLDGRTSLPGLFAVGEAACTGVHGANRLASNSLLEGAVFGRRAAAALARLDEPDQREPGIDTADGNPVSTSSTSAASSTRVRPSGIDRGELQRLMWQHAGLVRDEVGLAAASEVLSVWESAPTASTTRTHIETANLLTVARVVVSAASLRRESRGAHYRSDYPNTEQLAESITHETRKVSQPC